MPLCRICCSNQGERALSDKVSLKISIKHLFKVNLYLAFHSSLTVSIVGKERVTFSIAFVTILNAGVFNRDLDLDSTPTPFCFFLLFFLLFVHFSSQLAHCSFRPLIIQRLPTYGGQNCCICSQSTKLVFAWEIFFSINDQLTWLNLLHLISNV